jgi:hypothetical protein
VPDCKHVPSASSSDATQSPTITFPMQRERPWYEVPDPIWNSFREIKTAQQLVVPAPLTPPKELTPAYAPPSKDVNTTQAGAATSKTARGASPSSENDAGLSSQLSEKAPGKKRKRDDDSYNVKRLSVARSSSSGQAYRERSSPKRMKILTKRR